MKTGCVPAKGAWRALPLFCLALWLSLPAIPSGGETQGISAPESVKEAPKPLFPAAYFIRNLNAPAPAVRETPRFVWVSSEAELAAQTPPAVPKAEPVEISLLLNNDILAFYGHPLSQNMGILGRYPVAELDARLTALAADYAAVNGGRGVRKAFYIIYGTVWPEGEIGIIREAVLLEYIEYALAHDILVFIDHQIGRYDPVESLRRMLPYLRYPNVHLALDPEWRTTKPMKEIGSVSAAEVNRAQKVMEDYIIEHQISGERMLVIHQFKPHMIADRPSVNASFNRVRLVHCADGFGNPNQKREAYARNAEAANIPIKAFKLFYNFQIPGAGYDSPLLSPREVLQLNPRPYLIMYQ